MYEETEDGFRPDGNYDIHGTPEGYKGGKDCSFHCSRNFCF